MIPFALSPIGAADALEAPPQQIASTQPRIWRFHDEYVLGTRLDVQVNSHSAELAAQAANVARSEIDRLERVFNHRREDSELSALNRSRLTSASADLFAVAKISETWRQLTHGAFDGRMGELLRLWAAEIGPDRGSIEHALGALRNSYVKLDPVHRGIEVSPGAVLSLDAIAKGYIVDAALNAALRAVPGIAGLAIGIGGDLRCWGAGPDCHGWRIGIADPAIPFLNAPLVDTVLLRNAAIATSGRGPRDLIGDRYRSATVSPFTGRPVQDVLSASVVTSHAADADAIATACMVLRPDESLALVDRLEGVAARITDARGQVHTSANWPMVQLAATSPQEHMSGPKKASSLPAKLRWPTDWVLSIDYKAPERQRRRSSDFRSPYMAMWITDEQNKPVRTLLMVGREIEWQRDNFVWWGSNAARAPQLVEMRSLPTSVSGRYPIYWIGVDDDWNPVPIGKYTLHLETSQERGKHSYRTVPLELGRERIRTELPNLPESGGIELFYGHPNERY